MPQTLEPALEWNEDYAWWPVRSSWSKNPIWLKKYWQGDIYYDAMGRPPIKENSWRLIYTENEYLMYLLRQQKESDYQTPIFKSVRGRTSPRHGY